MRHKREAYDLGGSLMSRDDYRTRKAKAKALRMRRAYGKRDKETRRAWAGSPGRAAGCY